MEKRIETPFSQDINLARLRECIRNQEQTLVTFVHPFFEYYKKRDTYYQFLQQLKTTYVPNITELLRIPFLDAMKNPDTTRAFQEHNRYLSSFFRTIRNKKQQVLMIVEEQGRVGETETIVRTQGFSGTTIAIETEKESPIPIALFFADILAMLDQLQVQELIVGGQYGSYTALWQQREHGTPVSLSVHAQQKSWTGHCVGGFIDGLLSTPYRQDESTLTRITVSPILYDPDFFGLQRLRRLLRKN